MPGYQQLRFMPHPSEMSMYPIEPIYGQVVKPQKKKSSCKAKQHPLFEDLKARNNKEKKEYERMMNQHRESNPYKFNSLQLIGSCNDLSYLDNFMSMPRQRPTQEMGQRNRSKGLSKSSSTVIGKGQIKEHRNSVPSDSAISAALMANLRGASSDDNLYESLEMIQYKKNLQNLNRLKKTKTVVKTGHPLFDSLRIENAMKSPAQRKNSSSNSNSPNNSSSSGDEYEIYPRFNTARNARQQRQSRNSNGPHMTKTQDQTSRRNDSIATTGSSESDDDWIIPRPRFFTGRMAAQQHQRKIVSPLPELSSTDESGSSINSGILR